MKITVSSTAKINLTLDILGKRADGYHDVKMIMQSVSLFEYVTLTENNSGKITVDCNNPTVPCDESNIVYKCAKAFYTRLSKECSGLHISIEKHIPTQAGLAGGSADGAAVLVGLNEIYNKPFTTAELEEIGGTVGSDIPFCVRGGTALAEGTGKELTSLSNIPMCYFVLVKPPIGISTAQAYGAVDSRNVTPECASDKMLPLLGDVKAIAKNLRNDFEDTLCIEELLKLKRDIQACDGALGACMTGSGSTVFGVFDYKQKAEKCAEYFKTLYEDVFVTEPTNYGTAVV